MMKDSADGGILVSPQLTSDNDMFIRPKFMLRPPSLDIYGLLKYSRSHNKDNGQEQVASLINIIPTPKANVGIRNLRSTGRPMRRLLTHGSEDEEAKLITGALEENDNVSVTEFDLEETMLVDQTQTIDNNQGSSTTPLRSEPPPLADVILQSPNPTTTPRHEKQTNKLIKESNTMQISGGKDSKCGFVGKKKSCKCGKVFKQAVHLTRHINTYLNPKEYPCSKCGKVFLQKSDVKRHFIAVHVGNTLSCPYCEKTFSYRYPMILHCNKEHPGLDHPARTKRGMLLVPVTHE